MMPRNLRTPSHSWYAKYSPFLHRLPPTYATILAQLKFLALAFRPALLSGLVPPILFVRLCIACQITRNTYLLNGRLLSRCFEVFHHFLVASRLTYFYKYV